MKIEEMHRVFRVLGQQMGMQLNRGILPEAIDVYLNQAIIEKVQTEVLAGVHTALQDSVNTQTSVMSNINVFRTLYRIERLDVVANNLRTDYVSRNSYQVFNIPASINSMLYLGVSVEYNDNMKGNAVACRLIGSDVLETTLRDYCNGADKDSPIVCLNNNGTSEQLSLYINTSNTEVKYLNIKYIKNPNEVKNTGESATSIDCDLPDYCHYEIVERAVAKYYASIGVQSSNNQQNNK